MAYVVLARKWRPQNFEELVGQPHIARTLQNAIRLGRVAHAFLFTGSRGVGKTTTARILAKALNCREGPTPHPCNACESCRETAANIHPDVIEIDGASNRGIDEIRDLRARVHYSPVKGRYKVYIIDEVHMLTREAFNALLKTLEEPPGHVVFVLATTEVGKVPGTILSRCQRYDFRLISEREIADHLRRVVEAEALAVAADLPERIARGARGSMRDAQSLLDQVVAYGAEGMGEAELADLLGLIEYGALCEVVEGFLDRQPRRPLDIVREIVERGQEVRTFARELLRFVRDLAVLRAAPEAVELVAVAAEYRDQVAALARRATDDELQFFFSQMGRAEQQMSQAEWPEILLEMAFLRICTFRPFQSAEQLVERLEKLQHNVLAVPGEATPDPQQGSLFAGAAPPPAAGGRPDRKGGPPEEWPSAGGAERAQVVRDASSAKAAVDQAVLRRKQRESDPRAEAHAYDASDDAGEGAEEMAVGLAGDEAAPHAGLWERVCREAREEGDMVHYLAAFRVVSCVDGVLTLGYRAEDRYNFEMLRSQERMTKLRELVRRASGEPLRIEFLQLDHRPEEAARQKGSTGPDWGVGEAARARSKAPHGRPGPVEGSVEQELPRPAGSRTPAAGAGARKKPGSRASAAGPGKRGGPGETSRRGAGAAQAPGAAGGAYPQPEETPLAEPEEERQPPEPAEGPRPQPAAGWDPRQEPIVRRALELLGGDIIEEEQF